MSKPVTRTHTDALFEIGGQWIGTETNRVGFYRYWYQPGTQTVRRKKLRSANLEDAKLELAQIILSQEEPTVSSPLAQVLLTYHEEHSDKLPSRKLARMSSRKLLAFVGAEALVEEQSANLARTRIHLERPYSHRTPTDPMSVEGG